MLSALAPVATAKLPTGQRLTYRNGGLPAGPAAAARKLCVRAARRSEYKPQLHALPVANPNPDPDPNPNRNPSPSSPSPNQRS